MSPVDVLIAGGGVVGSAVAYFLSTEPSFGGTVLVVEPDPSYRFAASSRSASSIRQQFSTPLNIALSRFGLEFLRAGGLPGSGDLTDVEFHAATYLYLASPAGLEILTHNVAVQRACAVDARLYAPDALAARYPWLEVRGLAAGADTGTGEGWFDGFALLGALRRANQRRGVRYLRDRVAAIELGEDQRVEAVRLAGGETLRCAWLVNAAGTRARTLAASAGIDVPVFARKRNVFVFTSPAQIPDCPLVIDPSGVWFRGDGSRFLCGPVPTSDPDVDPDDFEVDHAQFEDLAWPALAHRVPAFEQARVTGAWAGHYDYNSFDQNAFIGPCEAVPNLLLACGFSGHGLQHSPGVGRAIAEWIAFGEYRSIDLGPFAHARYARAEPLRELNVI
ncbi:MAG: FAD-binding oxidoreductase [Gammaproteobacteria bacterium]|nr:FAD-binding oxidoreductase [Gammaproteobacteria bacterium]